MTDQLYVGIEEPKDARRLILESSRGIVKGLTAYEDLREIRIQKVELSLEFTSNLKELKSLMRKLKSSLPKIEVSKSAKKHPLEIELEMIEREIQNLH